MDIPLLERYTPFFTWQKILDWAKLYYPSRTFIKDERIPTCPRLLYLMEKGAIRMLAKAKITINDYQNPITHAQISSAIGSTRVTVTKLMGKLGQLGLISVQEDNLICLYNK